MASIRVSPLALVHARWLFVTGALAFAAMVLSGAPAALAQSGDDIQSLRAEIQALKAGQTAMQK